MPGYWIARSRVNDPAKYKRYTDLVPGILDQYGGKALTRGGAFRIMEGSDRFNRFVIVEFPSMDDAIACFESDAYQKAAQFRRDGSGEVEIVITDSLA